MSIKKFIKHQSSDGDKDSEGGFTIAADGSALRKLAKYSLPFKGAWAVKIVQALVCAGVDSIAVAQSKTETMFRFSGGSFPSLFRIKEQFGSASAGQQTFLGYLIDGLRAVGMQQSRAFSLALGEDGCLDWDEENLVIMPSKPGQYLCLKHLSKAEHKEYLWLVRSSVSAERNSDVLLALRERCFVCPVPLSVDRVRLDNLLDYPRVKDNHFSDRVLLGLDELDIDSPSWSMPAQTKESLKQAFKAALTLPEEQSPKAVVILAAQFLRGDRSNNLGLSKSILSFIHNGAVSEREALPLGDSQLTFHLFVSAQGLQFDLSGFALTNNEEKQRRREELFHALDKLLSDERLDGNYEVKKALSPANHFGNFLIGTLMLTGMTGFLGPLVGFGKIFLVSAGGGALMARGVSDGNMVFEDDLQESFRVLKERWQQFYTNR